MSTYSKEQWASLVEQTKSTLPSELGDQAWYILIVSSHMILQTLFTVAD